LWQTNHFHSHRLFKKAIRANSSISTFPEGIQSLRIPDSKQKLDNSDFNCEFFFFKQTLFGIVISETPQFENAFEAINCNCVGFECITVNDLNRRRNCDRTHSGDLKSCFTNRRDRISMLFTGVGIGFKTLRWENVEGTIRFERNVTQGNGEFETIGTKRS
jgi:hypothetical protein